MKRTRLLQFVLPPFVLLLGMLLGALADPNRQASATSATFEPALVSTTQPQESGEQESRKQEEVFVDWKVPEVALFISCLLYTSPSPRDQRGSRMPSSA